MSQVFASAGAAERYGPARALPDETLAVWMATLRELFPPERIQTVVDLGAGTGRFTAALHEMFGCPVIAVEPSQAMLQQGKGRVSAEIEWRLGSAEKIPAESGSIDLVWMSQVFHHLDQPDAAFQEIHRVLTPDGYLALRNGTIENDMEIAWNRFFPEAHTPVPARQDAIDKVCTQGFQWLTMRTLHQLFVSSYQEYYGRIRQRGLSALINISDEAFESGLERLREWTEQQPVDQPVYEPMDLFIFRVCK
jgi:ubiquinone/menaquinone biosynthesis C-methylase UbiE